MSDLIDDEAREETDSSEETSSSGEEFDDDDDFGRSSTSKKKKKDKKTKKKTREIIDSSEEDEEEDDEEAEEEMRDLINDEEEEEEEDEDDSDDDGNGTKRSHDDDDDSSSLEDDDIDLIQENLGVRIDKKKKFKRIKKVSDDDSEEEADEGRKIQNELFGNDLINSDEEEDAAQSSRPNDRDLDLDLDDEEESDSDDNFIVDDNDQPIARRSKKKGARYTDSAMQQAQEIFGVDFDYSDIEDDDNDGYDEGAYDEDYNEDGEERPKKKKDGRRKIQDVYEPAELQRSHMTTLDQKIRVKDEPERFQLRPTPVTNATDEELEQEAEWIYHCAFDQQTTSNQEAHRDPIAGRRPEFIKPEIKYALTCIRNEKYEVPFIAAYRREYVPTISSSFDDTKDLWTIYKYDEQWCKLQASKNNIAGLYRDMRSYLESAPNSKIRAIEDKDLDRVHNAKTFHEIEDCRLHFKLYYSSLVNDMKLYTLENKIKEQQANKSHQKDQAKDIINENGEAEDGGGDENEDDDDGQSTKKLETEEPEETEEEKLYKKLSKFKISSSRDFYQRCRESDIGQLVQKFGLTPEQFGENLRDDYQRNNVAQHHIKPLAEAEKLLQPSSRFTTKEAILKAAIYMFAREIGCDPLVRQTVRKYYFENAVINTRPTTLGMKEIDENNPCYPLKFLKNKPVTKLVGEQILHLVNAEKDKLLEIHFSIEALDSIDPKRNLVKAYYESLKALYYSDFSSHVTKEWNEKREEAVRTAMDKYLIPCFEKQLREKLIKEAQEKIIKTSCEQLHNRLNIAPYSPSNEFDEYEDFELRNGIRICGFTFAPDGDAPCFAAIVDDDGELVDHVRLPYLNIRKRSDRLNAVERENQAKDRAKFKQFIINRKPHVVAVGAETIQTKYICTDLAQILDELREHEGLPLIPIDIVDNELSSIFMNLKAATEEFPEFPPLLLQAISNARKLNEPLSEYAKLCTHDDDILCMRFHNLQDDLPKDEFLTSLYQCFVTRTNAVGVDVNRAIVHPHTANTVQFIAGLGPRKAAHLVRSIKKCKTNGQLVSRQQLVTELGMTSVIFINCAGFIKLNTDYLAENFPDDHVTPLDSTRIHPESYGLAKKIASDALDYDDAGTDEAAANSIEEIFDTPDKLDDLDLGAFARELDEVQNQGKKAYTLLKIREEFQHRYKDGREPYKPISEEEEVFRILTKETPSTFYIGKLITCQVVAIIRKKPGAAQLDVTNPIRIDETNLWRCPFCIRSDFQDLSQVWNHFDTEDCPGYAIGVRCRLDNGLFGFIPTKCLSDKEISDPSERVAPGQTIHARVLKVDAGRFGCDLTCRTSDLIDEDCKLKPAKDEYYDEAAEKGLKRELEAKSKRSSRRPYCKRVIVHPAFENIDCKTCEKKLEQSEQGHAIIRPSSQGQNYLTLSWKVADGINQHVTIREEGKENAFSLGHQLFIENEPYEDLDEIIARYIQPMASFARELLNYKYCLKDRLADGQDEEMALQKVLISEKMAAPACFPYRFCPSRNLPGKFILGYIPKDKPKIEYLTVTPRGYRFRKLYFKNLASLIKWFKENWNKLPQIYPAVTPALGYDNMPNLNRQSFPMSH